MNRMKAVGRVGAGVAVVTTGVLLAGCTINGGGSFTGVDGVSNGSLAVQGSCGDKKDDHLTFNYQDQSGSGVHIQGEASGFCYLDGDRFHFEGVYTPKPKGEQGSYTVDFVDTGEKGPSKGDSFTIFLAGGEYSGYGHSATLDHGNLKTTNK